MIPVIVKKNAFLIIICAGLYCVWYFFPLPESRDSYANPYRDLPRFDPVEYNNKEQCYKSYAFQNEKSLEYRIKTISDIMHLLKEQDKRKLFFHKTDCIHDGVLYLTGRQACGVESAAKSNPDANVFLMYAAQVGWTNKTELPFIDALLSYPNIQIATLEVDTEIENYFKDTPAAEWIAERKMFKTDHISVHMNDFLRAGSLFNFGGTAIDLDVIVIKDLYDLEYNFAAPGSGDLMYSGILNLETDLVGHEIATELIKTLSTKYDPASLGYNGHWIFHKVIQTRCNFTEKQNIEPVDVDGVCQGFRIYPKNYFYGINWDNWLMSFEPINTDILQRFYKSIEESFIVHFADPLSKVEKVHLHDRSPYDSLARKHCPKIYQLLDGDF